MSNYPPGMLESDIPGIDDEDRNYTAHFRYVSECSKIQNVVDYIKETFTDSNFDMIIDLDSFKQVNDNHHEIYFDLIGVISIGPRDDPDEIEQYIKEELPSIVMWECEYQGYDLDD